MNNMSVVFFSSLYLFLFRIPKNDDATMNASSLHCQLSTSRDTQFYLLFPSSKKNKNHLPLSPNTYLQNVIRNNIMPPCLPTIGTNSSSVNKASINDANTLSKSHNNNNNNNNIYYKDEAIKSSNVTTVSNHKNNNHNSKASKISKSSSFRNSTSSNNNIINNNNENNNNNSNEYQNGDNNTGSINNTQMMMGNSALGMGYGMGMGYGGYGGYGYMSPYSTYGMGMGMGMGMMGGPLQGLNQFLFGIQSVVFSLGQAMQVNIIYYYLLYFTSLFSFFIEISFIHVYTCRYLE